MSARIPPRITGSSPLARGLRVRFEIRDRHAGIIPARAGFTEIGSRRTFPYRDHPRSRGVYVQVLRLSEEVQGSSPLARGLLDLRAVHDVPARIIPARAGFTKHEYYQRRRPRDHPRSRGVYLRARCVFPQPSGIIPARAGFTRRRGRAFRRIGDHPRSRGVYFLRRCSRRGPLGSSPLARGLRPRGAVVRRHPRIIPARAGFTSGRCRSW